MCLPGKPLTHYCSTSLHAQRRQSQTAHFAQTTKYQSKSCELMRGHSASLDSASLEEHEPGQRGHFRDVQMPHIPAFEACPLRTRQCPSFSSAAHPACADATLSPRPPRTCLYFLDFLCFMTQATYAFEKRCTSSCQPPKLFTQQGGTKERTGHPRSRSTPYLNCINSKVLAAHIPASL